MRPVRSGLAGLLFSGFLSSNIRCSCTSSALAVQFANPVILTEDP